MAHDFDGPLNPQRGAAELILEARIAALRHCALVITNRVCGFKFFFEAAARVMVNQRYMIQASAVLMQRKLQ